MDKKPKICVIGLGYIGLPTASLMASKEYNVLGIDTNLEVVKTINQGKIHIVEPNLSELVKSVVKKGFLKASNTPEESDVFIIAVPTPFKENKKPDISYVQAAIDSIAPKVKEKNIIIIESTSPIGTTEKMESYIYEKFPKLKNKIFISYCPERVLPGNILFELEQKFYKSFIKGNLHQTNARTAEMCKLVENASRDVQIAFANELSIICDEAKIDTNELIFLANKHPRVNILQPGTGVGGHCIAVDPWFIVSDFPDNSILIKTARELNDYKTKWVIH